MILTATIARRSPTHLLGNLVTFTKSSVTAAVLAVVLSLACSTVCPSQLQAQGPENTIVVVNEESPDSLAIANLYISLRNIPATNVVYLSGVTNQGGSKWDSSDSSKFYTQIWKPVSDAIKTRGLSDQISCITYSAGFPTRINFQPELDKYLEQTGRRYNKVSHAPWASISSLTYFAENAFSDKPTFLELNANRYASLRPGTVLANPFVGEAGRQYTAAGNLFKQSKYAEAIAIYEQLVKANPDQITVIYALARAHALNDDEQKVIQLLEEARSKGFAFAPLVDKEPSFIGIKQERKFRTILDNMEALPEGTLPTRGFSRSYWSKNGWPSGSSEQGQRYLLSTVLAVVHEEASTLDQALTQIKTSVKADGTQPRGIVHFTKNGDARSKTRHFQFDFASKELKSLGRPNQINGGRFPKNNPRVIGATLGSSGIDWKSSGSKFLPGALCDNFTSYGGCWAVKPQTKLTEYLNNGAAGASGTVVEPYTVATKIPNARLHAHYARGCTLAEAFYQSVSGPFQLLIAGDPLCCPFGDFPKFQVTGLKKNSKVNDDFELTIKVSSNSPKLRYFEIYYDGVLFSKVDGSNKINVATDSMTDGFHELRIVGIANTPTANRSSKTFSFEGDRASQSVSIEADTKRIPITGKLKLTAITNTKEQIEIRQNSRVIATIDSGQQIEIKAAKLGLGKTKLHAVTKTSNGGIVASTPLDIVVSR